DALVLAGLAAQTVIEMQASAPDGVLGAALEDGTNFQFVVHQAAGMVAVQLTVSVTEALIRLRAYAFRHDLLVSAVARHVVEGRLRFDGREPGQ
ncbi:MAG: ANTAR domain-containing protein, partial [Ilumatobacteraceae bacterium]